MAMHTDLPIHKVAFDLLSLATDVTRNIPRDFKAGLGAKVRDECIEIMVLIARANAAKDKHQDLSAKETMNTPTYCRTTGQRIGTCRCLRCTTTSPQERAACPE